MAEAAKELDKAICAIRVALPKEFLETMPELTRAGIDLALAHGRKALAALEEK